MSRLPLCRAFAFCVMIGSLLAPGAKAAPIQTNIVAGPGEAGLRAAIQSAQAGDTVVVTNWVELTNSLRIDKRITIRGSEDFYQAWILGRFNGALIEIAAEGIVFESLRLIGSPQTDGLLVRHEVVLRDCTIDHFRVPVVNDVWYDPNFRVRMERVIVTRNEDSLNCYNLEAIDSTFSYNKGTGGGGWNADLDGCVFEYNEGDGLNVTFGQVRNCVFRFNSGLGLRSDPDPGIMYLSGSLFYANGEGALLLREEAHATIDNCTFTRHTGRPAIVATEYNNILMRHCTIVDNVVLNPYSIPSPDETGGAFVIENGSRVEMQNCLVANNPTSEDANASGMFGPWIDGGGNVIGGSPNLSQLRDNGGPTFTLLPLPGSPALDAGIPSDLIRDARGLSRLAGDAPDAGAVEANATPLADVDADGLPDLWEAFHGLSAVDPTDATTDTDGDRQNALAEYYSGTDPGDPRSVHRFEQFVVPPAPLLQPFPRTIYFIWSISPGVKYEVESSADLLRWRRVDAIWIGPYGGDNGRLQVYFQIEADAPASFDRVRATASTVY